MKNFSKNTKSQNLGKKRPYFFVKKVHYFANLTKNVL